MPETYAPTTLGLFSLSQDPNFHYETLRSIGLARYMGGDIGEQLNLIPKIRPGDLESWYREWRALALRVLAQVDEGDNLGRHSDATVRDVYFRASHYFFVSDFFLHGDVADPRLRENFDLWRKYYDLANARLDIPGEHVLLDTPSGFRVPLIIYRAARASAGTPRPTLLVGGGFDSNYEESMHTFGFAALERGYNVILYEGPGQPTLLHTQKVGFIHDWERVVTPIMDYLFEHQKDTTAFIDPNKVGLIGLSLGGFLSLRAAAFEPRLAAVIAIDGVYSFLECGLGASPELAGLWEKGDAEAFNAAFEALAGPDASTNRRWIHDHMKFSFQEKDPWTLFQTVAKMDLGGGVAQRIKMPAFVGEAEGDLFFGDQPQRVAREIGPNATLVKFGTDQAASAHVQSGANAYLNARIGDWFASIVGF